MYHRSMIMWSGLPHLAWFMRDGCIIKENSMIMRREWRITGCQCLTISPLRLQPNPDHSVTWLHSYIKGFMCVYVVMRVIGMSYNLFGEESVNKTTATPMKCWVMVHISLRNIDTLTRSNCIVWYRKTFILYFKYLFKYKSVNYTEGESTENLYVFYGQSMLILMCLRVVTFASIA